MAADMGSTAPMLEEAGGSELGQELWEEHKKIVGRFWDSIAQFFDEIEVNGFKVYQDGLVADGAEAVRIVEEGIRQGSKNFGIIGVLLQRGAVLVRTEDLALVKKEYAHIVQIARSKSLREKQIAMLRYKRIQAELLRKRDDFVATRIKETLNEGETGILFIGAYHNVSPRLPADVQVRPVKDVARVRDYHNLLMKGAKNIPRLRQLADNLSAPVTERF